MRFLGLTYIKVDEINIQKVKHWELKLYCVISATIAMFTKI